MGRRTSCHGRRRGLRVRCTLACLLLCIAPLARAAHTVRLTAASVEWSGMVAHEVTLTVHRPGPGSAIELRIGQARGLPAAGSLSRLRLDCAHLDVSGDSLGCSDGRLAGNFGVLGAQDSGFSLRLTGDDRLHARLPSLALAGGRASLDARLVARRWTVGMRFSQLNLDRLAAMPAVAARLPSNFSLSGAADGTLDAAGDGSNLVTARLELGLDALTFANESGTAAGEKLRGHLHVALTRRKQAAAPWTLDAGLSADAGQAYLDPVFVDIGARPLQVELAGALSANGTTLSVGRFLVAQRSVGRVDGSAELDASATMPLRSARIRFADVDLSAATPVYLVPFLVGTQFQDLKSLGRVTGEVDVDGGRPSRVDLTLEGVTLDSVTGALGVQRLAGRLRWVDEDLHRRLAPGESSAQFESRITWQALRLWGIRSGPVTLPFTATGNNFRLLEPVLLPVFDGGLAIGTLRIRHAGTPQMYLRFDAELRPISMAQLTEALGWPQFSGTLSGSIPRLELSHGLVTLGGDLVAQVFDGTIAVHGLQLRDPLGRHPQLFADIDAQRLDLERVTGTFSFGAITGRLSGQVKGLETFDWMPVAFDAKFYTTPGDRSPHRISQRAITNLSSIGGGSGGSVASALQGGFLRFFKNFSYDRLGLSCRLANDVCHMDGVAPAPNGYYIVKGSGLPRIDVIGNQRQVAWTRLVRQLAAMMQSSGPIVK